jgi:hypothetical protein
MRTNMAQTSLSAFKSIPVEILTESERKVLEVMRDGVARTRLEIANELRWRDGPTCGRCNSLVTKGVLIPVGERKNPGSRVFSEVLQIPPSNPQGVLFQ